MAVNTFHSQNTEFGVNGLLTGTLALTLKKLFSSFYCCMTHTFPKDRREGKV